ncbi:LytR family transcriptional attenuator [Actinocorallia herbida]|uniref:LytR family transcriptional attenuator n=1 Tax=Actinocorallia herbida TaxID=58109 RepID=A0A3N1D993_9ACTN|nr:LCP family protein [Actinocorallia herbida]ROO90039.1 LytR family transcriptional attenuator [Actinocorallia herbida]
MRGGIDYDLEFLETPEISGAYDTTAPQGKAWKIIQWVSIGLAACLVLGSLTAYGFYYKFAGNIKQETDPGNIIEANRPKKLDSSVNILVLGSDTRAGKNGGYGSHIEGERSDTAIVLHLSAGGEKATAISFPRDSWVSIPECKDHSGKTIGARTDKINSAFAYAGAYCTWATIESLTQIRIDHYVKVDFTGFKDIVNALDGVEICSPIAFEDPKAQLVIPKAGKQKINGKQALGWARTRYKLGDGSDLGRIQRQQQLMSSIVQKVTSKGILTNPTKLLGFVNAATKSLKTDEGFNSTEITDLATKVKGLRPDSIKFVTVPWRYATEAERASDASLAGVVFWQEDKAQELFDAIRRDNKVPKNTKPKKPTATEAAADGEAAAPAADTPKVKAADVVVKVYNGTDRQGLAGRAVTDLTTKKYQASLGSTGSYQNGALEKTVIAYGTGGEAAAALLGKLLPDVTPKLDATLEAGTVHLYLGADYAGLGSAASSIPEVDDEVTASDDICKAGGTTT